MSAAHRIEAARRARAGGDGGEAERLYAAAADLARAQGDTVLLAHAARHVSDLARERGDWGAALRAAEEAVALYRGAAGSQPLDLANAVRLAALAREAGGIEAGEDWREARLLYREAAVPAGVAECDRHLARTTG